MKPDVKILKYTLPSGYIVDMPDLNGALYLDVSTLNIGEDIQLDIKDLCRIVKYKDLNNEFYDLNLSISDELEYIFSKYYIYCIGLLESDIKGKNVINTVITTCNINADTGVTEYKFNIYTVYGKDKFADDYLLTIKVFKDNYLLSDKAIVSFNRNYNNKDVIISDTEPTGKKPLFWIKPSTNELYYYNNGIYSKVDNKDYKEGLSNLLINSGFNKVDYDIKLNSDYNLEATDNLDTDLLYKWRHDGAKITDNKYAISNKSVVLSNGYIEQSLLFIPNKQYTLSFNCIGDILSINGVIINISKTLNHYVITPDITSNVIKFEGSCELFDIKLEYGDRATGWINNMMDLYNKHIDMSYLTSCMKEGSSTNDIILTGLLNSVFNTSGISGISNTPNDIFIWSGDTISNIYNNMNNYIFDKSMLAILQNGMLISIGAYIYNSLLVGSFKSNISNVRFEIKDDNILGFDSSDNIVFNINISSIKTSIKANIPLLENASTGEFCKIKSDNGGYYNVVIKS